MSRSQTQVECLLAEAVEIADERQRREYLRGACGDAEVRQEVERLLRDHFAAGDFLEMPPAALVGAANLPLAQIPGTRIGPYKLLQVIGEGGMGVVYMAEQKTPVERQVALKIIKPGMDSRQVIARFEAERQALAMMDHPHIAKVLDAGTVEEGNRGQETGNRGQEWGQIGVDADSLSPVSCHLSPPVGRPYFVMELVKGVPITTYCDEKHLTVNQRLELFVPICQAIQHAHQKGIIHRDLKPTNVLVAEYDNQPVPKVIDFGVAKATGLKLTEQTMFTGFGELIGTLEYMSPEQAHFNQLDIDTRSDIYSLGVLLYELLTGTTPIEQARIRTLAFDETLRIIREEEPQKPSTRLSIVRNAERGMRKPAPHASFRIPHLHELDWIVMKCLEKERSRRYETANGLAMDLKRYLQGEPVQACPPSALYRFRKFAARNKRFLGTSALLAVALLLAVGSLGWVLRDRESRRIEADLRAQSAVDDAIRLRDQKRWADARAATRRVELLLAPGESQAQLRRQLRDIAADLDMVERVEAIRLGQADVKDGWWDHVGADHAYARAFREYGIDAAVLDGADAAQRVRASAIREQLIAALDDWSFVIPAADAARCERVRAIAGLADPDEWRNRFRDSTIQTDRKALEELASRTEVKGLPPSTVVLLGRRLQTAGAGGKSIEVLTEGQRRFPTDFWLNIELSRMLRWHVKPPRYEEAVGFCRAALAIRPDSPGVWVGLGTTLRMPNHADEAIAAFHKAISLQPDYAEPHHQLGRALAIKRAWTDAAAAFREAIRLKPDVAIVHKDLGLSLRQSGDLQSAADAFRQAVVLRPGVVDYRALWGTTCLAMGDQAGHRRVCRDMVRQFGKTKDPNIAAGVVCNCVSTPHALEDTESLVQLGYLAGSKKNGLPILGAALYRAGDYKGAAFRLEQANSRGAWDLLFLAMAHHQLGQEEQAQACLKQATMQIDANRPQWPEEIHTNLLRREAEELIGQESGIAGDRNQQP